MTRDARLAGRWTPDELGVHPVAGGGPLPRYVRRAHDERLRVILAPPVADSRLVVVRGEPCTGTSRAAWEAVAELLAEWPLEYPRTAAALAARLQAGIPAGTVLWLGELGLDDLRDVARLLAALRAAGAGEAAGVLARRAAGAGIFGLFLADRSDEAVRPGGSDPDRAVSYRYGCEPELAPSPPWRWTPPDPGGRIGPAREN